MNCYIFRPAMLPSLGIKMSVNMTTWLAEICGNSLLINKNLLTYLLIYLLTYLLLTYLLTYVLTYLLTYLLTYSLLTCSTQHIPSWEANKFSASQEIPPIFWNPKFHYRIYKCPPARLTLRLFRSTIRFYSEELLAPRPTPKLDTTTFRWSATAYSTYLQLPSILVAVPTSATWGGAMASWQRPTYHGYIIIYYTYMLLLVMLLYVFLIMQELWII